LIERLVSGNKLNQEGVYKVRLFVDGYW